jgi:DNA polymerase-1
MSKTPKLLLVDGPNLCFREFYSQKNLSYKGKSVDVLYGVFKSLISLHKKWPEHFRVIAWEGGYKRRLEESEAAVASGLIPSSYKQTRRDKVESGPDPELESLFEQMEILKELLDKTKTLQVRVKGYEADDVIYSYVDWALRHNGEAIIVSSDKDFYQCLNENVKVFDARIQDVYTLEKLETECGFPVRLWLDKAAIEGEVGASKDNIFGVDGWGPKTAMKYISEYGDIDAILENLKKKGNLSKKEEVFLQQEKRLRLAKSLKRMDVIPDLPMPRIKRNIPIEEVKKIFIEWGFSSLLKDAYRFI